jgi:deoxyribodipyrimidine photolyase-related protein
LRSLVLFPHQLFEAALSVPADRVYLVEDELFFSQVLFHKQKLVLHRASMGAFARRFQNARIVPSIDAIEGEPIFFDPVDDWLERRIRARFPGVEFLSSPMFLCEPVHLQPHFELKRASMASFYAAQRKRLGILLTPEGGPIGGKWSFDAENRRKLPKVYPVPPPQMSGIDPAVARAAAEIDAEFPDHPGCCQNLRFPITHEEARQWLDNFLAEQLAEFGPFEDAVSVQHPVLFHSQLTPMLNTGLLTPREVVDATLRFAQRKEVPIASLEGFLRQIIGWREFMRGAYVHYGRAMRTRNELGLTRKLGPRFWTGETGLAPAHLAIRRALDSAYIHHIERLMILGSLMVLLRVHPDEVYRWFMELTIDAHDWVMVPNVYGMSQFADGGLITTKPYVSGSNYLRNMSDIPTGDWCDDWDALFWCFVEDYRPMFERNPRTSAMTKYLDRKSPAQRAAIRERANALITRLTLP